MPTTLSNWFNWYWWKIYQRWKYLGWSRRIALHSHIDYSCHSMSCVFSFAENYRLLPSHSRLIACTLRFSQSPELPIEAVSLFKYSQFSCFIEYLWLKRRESGWYRQRRNEFRANIAPQFIIARRWKKKLNIKWCFVRLFSRILIEIRWERMVKAGWWWLNNLLVGISQPIMAGNDDENWFLIH